MSIDVLAYLDRSRDRVERYLDGRLPPGSRFPTPLFEAVRYSLFAGGKRFRPALMFAATEAVGGDPVGAEPFAAALEMIHTYSLIHDDLPAMDDDDLRRGRATNHKVYGDGMAILAGDALLTDAFVVMTRPEVVEALSADRVARGVALLAGAAGSGGMVAGQALDLTSEGKQLDLPTLEFLHTHKTGALIRAAVLLGGLSAGADARATAALDRYAERMGLAFQIADDVLDVEGDTETLGKPVGSDEAGSKATYPALLGLGESRRRALELLAEALEALAPLGSGTEALKALARFGVERHH